MSWLRWRWLAGCRRFCCGWTTGMMRGWVGVVPRRSESHRFCHGATPLSVAGAAAAVGTSSPGTLTHIWPRALLRDGLDPYAVVGQSQCAAGQRKPDLDDPHHRAPLPVLNSFWLRLMRG